MDAYGDQIVRARYDGEYDKTRSPYVVEEPPSEDSAMVAYHFRVDVL